MNRSPISLGDSRYLTGFFIGYDMVRIPLTKWDAPPSIEGSKARIVGKDSDFFAT